MQAMRLSNQSTIWSTLQTDATGKTELVILRLRDWNEIGRVNKNRTRTVIIEQKWRLLDGKIKLPVT